MRQHFARVVLILPLLVVIGGCGSSDLGTVEGTVKLDGDPLKDAVVTFQPAKGRPSIGTTDENGHYELMYLADQPGAKIGTHTVRISAEITKTDASGEEEVIGDRVPKKYNEESELKKEVKPGSNTIDFDLESN